MTRKQLKSLIDYIHSVNNDEETLLQQMELYEAFGFMNIMPSLTSQSNEEETN